MSLTRALNIGTNGMGAAAMGTAVTGHNLTNATTEGYARQQIDQRAIPMHMGGGVNARQPLRIADRYTDRRLTNSKSFEGEASARAESLRVLDDVFSEGDGTLAHALDEFEGAVAQLSNDPSDGASRIGVLSAAGQLAASFNGVSEQLTNARADANSRIDLETDAVNVRLEQIGALNAQILQGASGYRDVSTLVDNRDQLVREVSERVPVTVIEGQEQTVSLLLGGSRSLVDENGEVRRLLTTVDTNGDRVVLRETTSGTEDVTSLMTTGKIAGYIDARDTDLADAHTALDQLAEDMTTAYNTVHAAGFGLDGVTGRNLFDPAAAGVGAASQMAVSADVLGNPDAVAAATVAGLSGDNRGILNLMALAETDIAMGGTETASGSLGRLVGQVGAAVKSADGRAEHATLSLEQAQRLRDSVSGVSSDEEMVSLMRYQRAYQASLRIIQTADEMLSELLNLGR